MVAFVALSKVLSPQFLVWLVRRPARRRARRRGGDGPAVVVCALTAIWFPARYWDLVRDFDPLSSWIVLLRGLVLLLPARGAHLAGHGARTGSIAVARPIAGSHVDQRALEPHATRGRLEPHRHARPASAAPRAPSATPITESCGPVIPTSVSAAVPPGRIRPSDVCTGCGSRGRR